MNIIHFQISIVMFFFKLKHIMFRKSPLKNAFNMIISIWRLNSWLQISLHQH